MGKLTANEVKAKAAAVTFREAALALHKAREHQWASSKHGGQWLATLETYAFPTLGAKLSSPHGVVRLDS